MQISWSAGFRARAGEPIAAKRLYADHRANHVPVDVGVADLESLVDVLLSRVDPAMDAQRQA